MRLKISDVSKILNIPIETLRFYEKNKVVMPHRDDTNNYRYYDTWDIFYIVSFLEFRNMGFSVKEATDAIHKRDISFIADTIGNKIIDIKNKIKHEQMMLDYLSNYQKELKTISYNLGLYWYELMPEQKYIYFSEEEQEEYPGMNPQNTRFGAWLNAVPYTRGVKHISLDDEMNIMEDDYWSFMMESKYLDFFGIEENEAVKTIPEQLCLTTYIDAGKRGEITQKLFTPILNYIKEKQITIQGEILCQIVFRGQNNGEFRRYMKISVPIKK